MKPVVRLLSLFVVLAWGQTHAELQSSDEQGFVSVHELELAASPEESYRAFVDDVAAWWDANHSFSGQASAFSIDDRAGGCFCEIHGDVEVEHLRVVNVKRGSAITLRGGLGPLQGMAVTGSMSLTFEPAAVGTLLKYRYSVGGYLPGGLKPLAGPVDQVQLGQLKRLQAYLAERAD